MKEESPISPFQLTSLLIVCRLFTLITLAPRQPEAGSYFAGLALGAVVQLCIALLLVRLFAIQGKGRLAGLLHKAVHALCWLACMVTAALSADSCADFISRSYYGGRKGALLLAVLVAAAALTVFFGLNSFARAAPAVGLIAVAGLGALVMGAASGMDVRFMPPLTFSPRGAAEVALYSTATCFELLALPLLQRRCTKPLKRSAIAFWVGLCAAVSAALSLSIMLSLGYYAVDRRYPVYELARVSHLFTERMDTLLMGIWVLLGFIKVSVALWLACDLWGKAFTSATRGKHSALHGVAAAGAALLLLTGCSPQDTISNKTIVTMVEMTQGEEGLKVSLEYLDMSQGKDKQRYLVCSTAAESFNEGVGLLEQEYGRQFYLQGCSLAVLSGSDDESTISGMLEQLDATGELRPLTNVLASREPVLEVGEGGEVSESVALRRLFKKKGGGLDDGCNIKDCIARSRNPHLGFSIPIVSTKAEQAVITGQLSFE